ncbi:SurA N-terminal domain-containing protein [Paenibacillus sp. YYML68]|uniref:SurA N-terminal domain-containing protein n=1 Tax=Paenibacillus sp. YYML68 TaxID=2909250 RepID=UPI002491FB36|nr:peptidyl-prolyl cis-trans isomerase [Paenibacillus sp. YYML68]
MRNVKLLWGVIIVLLVVVGTLLSVLTARTSHLNADEPEMNPPNQADDKRMVAHVGERTITMRELQAQLLAKHGKETLIQMIDHEVIRNEAEASGIQISEQEMKRELERMRQGYDSEQQYYEAMKEQLGLTREQLEADVRHRLLVEKLSIRGIQVTDREVSAYIAENQDEFKDIVSLRFSMIVTASRDHAQRAISDLNKGIPFDKVAWERSLDDVTRESGGDMGWLEEEDPFVPPAIMKAAKQLQPGQISKPLEVEGQYVVLMLTERKVQSKGSPEIIREQVRKELALRIAPSTKETLAKLRDKWKVRIVEKFQDTNGNFYVDNLGKG